MIELKKIVLATDFSTYSDSATKFGCALAEQFDSELHVLHVLQDLVAVVPEPGVAFPPPGDYMDELRKSAEQALQEVIDSAWEQGKRVVRAIRQGPPFLEIVRYAKEVDADLIVLGTHGRTGLAHVLLGSVAEKVVRKASCPVLTVRHDAHEFRMP